MADKVEQLEFSNENPSTQTGPVTCLGMTFESDEARRAYFREELRKKLPELRKIEGFPIGEDEDILALSDPPYYTACPNPWIEDFVKEWEITKPAKPDNYQYRREPFTADVSEGKNDPIYNAHSYHTKVPHKAIMRYILHFTDPGDVILDAFSGTGMTGIAATCCGDKDKILELGYEIVENDIFVDGEKVSSVGVRNVILGDLSPNATNISRCYNIIDINKEELKKELYKILNKAENELGQFYRTRHHTGEFGKINYVIWSDVFYCSVCSNEIVYWDNAVNANDGTLSEEFMCPHCSAQLKKNKLNRVYESVYDMKLGSVIKLAKQIPVVINYTIDGKRFEKKPDEFDIEQYEKVRTLLERYEYPVDKLPNGYNTSQPINSHGLTHVHHFYISRNLITFSFLINEANKSKERDSLLFLLSALHIHINKMRRYQPVKPGGTPGLPGTLFVSSINVELSIFDALPRKLRDITKYRIDNKKNVVVTTGSASAIDLPPNSVDYIFTDPPFGSNLMYSELNYLWESWLKIKTNNVPEAIVNAEQHKNISEYKSLMEQCFVKYYNVLKPGRWMTVEFSNSQASIWNAIREAIEKAGFVIANVAALDKKQGSFKAVTTTTAVKQDLVISAYKPDLKFTESISNVKDTEDSAWNFVKYHLEQLPVFIGEKGSAEIIVERTPRVLFDRMVAYHVQNGLNVPISSAEFQSGIEQRFPMRDGMAFLETQVAEYDKKRIQAKEFVQLSLFVSDENSAIEWLRQQLLKKPQTRQDLHPNFMKEIQHIAKHEKLPELDVLLEQNFLMYDGEGEVPSQIHTYLSSDYKDLRNLSKNDPKLIEKAKNRWYVPDPNKQADLEKLREKSLLREFNQYVEELSNNKKKLKQFRTEAIRVGFYKAWTEKNYQIIVDIGNRLPESILQEDEKLLRYYDNAQTKLGL